MEALSINCGESESIGYAPDVLADAEVGDHVSFGTYEQDSDNSNGPEEIEWIKTVVLPYEEAARQFIDGKNLIALFLYERWKQATSSQGC